MDIRVYEMLVGIHRTILFSIVNAHEQDNMTAFEVNTSEEIIID
jgi:hypothetical protein